MSAYDFVLHFKRNFEKYFRFVDQQTQNYTNTVLKKRFMYDSMIRVVPYYYVYAKTNTVELLN